MKITIPKDIDQAEKVIMAYKRLFATEDGKLVLKDLGLRCHLFTSIYQEDKDVNAAFINEGKRQVVLTINSMIEFDVDRLKEKRRTDV